MCACFTGVRLMAGEFNPHAATTIAFLHREFELSYLLSGLSFFSGLEAFVFGLAIRSYTSLSGAAGQVSALLLLATAAGMVAYTQEMLVTYSSVGASIVRLLELLLHKVLLRSYFGYVSLTLGALALSRSVSSAWAFFSAPTPTTYAPPESKPKIS